jgi:hypothetical protein
MKKFEIFINSALILFVYLYVWHFILANNKRLFNNKKGTRRISAFGLIFVVKCFGKNQSSSCVVCNRETT